MGNSMNLVDRIEDGVKGLVSGVGKGVSYVVNDLGQDTKKLAVYGLAGAVVLGVGAGVAKGATTVSGFAQLVGTQGTFRTVEHFIESSPPYGYDNLMIRDSNGVDSVVSKDGTNVWRIGFAKYDGGNMLFGGYANNDNNISNSYPGYEGWCFGYYTDHIFADGDEADDVMIIHDKNGDGIGTVDGGVWTLGADDVVYWTEDIEFNGVQDGIDQLGTFNYIETKILPHMVVNPVAARSPIPGVGAKDIDLNVELSWTGAYGAVYHNVYFGTDPDNLENVSFEQSESTIYVEGLEWKSTYYWRVDEVDSEEVIYPGRIWSFDTIDDCSSSIVGDFNNDCIVDFEDFATFAENWLTCTRMGTGACP